MAGICGRWLPEQLEPSETTMTPNSISHRLFVAALTPGGPSASRRPAAARSGAARGPVKVSAKAAVPFSVLASRRLTEWSWSGWQHTSL